jgi:molybdopterin-guanine dinucleotide biosynthesis protein A/rhodanese-related sulfurtransferase
MVSMVAFGGAVLCGGSSRRMGRDKATLAIDGVPMAARVAAALREAGARPVLAVGGNPQVLTAAGLDVTADDHPGEGPLAATVTALRCIEQPLVIVAACDLLHPQPAALARVAAELAADADALVAVPVVDGRRQWAHAAWRRAALRPLSRAVDAGERAIHAAAAGLGVREVPGMPRATVADADAPSDLGEVGRVPGMDVPEIDVLQLHERLGEGAPLIDVREDDELAEARVPGVHHIPLGQVAERIAEVPTSGTVYVICARGARSAKAAAHYRAAGIDAVNVAGGTLAWMDAGLPIESGPPA